jgi:hypothetical protein
MTPPRPTGRPPAENRKVHPGNRRRHAIPRDPRKTARRRQSSREEFGKSLPKWQWAAAAIIRIPVERAVFASFLPSLGDRLRLARHLLPISEPV